MVQNKHWTNHKRLALQLTRETRAQFFYFFTFIDLQNVTHDLFSPEDSIGNKILAFPNVAASNHKQEIKNK